MPRKIPLLVKVGIAPLVAGLIVLIILAWQVYITSGIERDAAAINLAGSQRMRLFKLVLLTEQYLEHREPKIRALIDQEMMTFETILHGLKHGDPRYALKSMDNPELTAYLDKSGDEWNKIIKPLFQNVLAASASRETLRTLKDQVEEYVTRIDTLVALLQADSEKKVDALHHLLRIFLLANIVIGLGSLIYIHLIILKPIKMLAETSRAIAAGDLSRAVPVLSKDEIGELASDFNEMSSRLKNHIEALHQKTVELEAQKALIETDRRAILGLKKYAEDIVASLPAGLIVVDDTLKVLSVNRSFRELFGLGNSEAVGGRDIEELLPLPILREQALGVLASGTAVHGIEAGLGEKRLRLAITGIRLAEEEEEEEEARLLMVVEDITERKQAEEMLARLGRILDNSSNEIYVFDGDTLRFVQVNQGAQQNLGYTPDELESLTPLDLKPEFDRRSFEDLIAPLRRGERDTVTFETVHKRKDGSLYPVEVRLHFSRTETPPVFVAIIQDITERKQAEARIEQLAFYDSLTGLPNRALFLDRLKQSLAAAQRHGQRVALLFLDLDRFKEINDTQGHAVGDHVLTEVARRLQAVLRQEETLARLGGDEFVAFVPGADEVIAAAVAERLQQALGEPLEVETQTYALSAGIGIAFYPEDGDTPEALLKHADIAMYRAKAGGGYRFYRPEMGAKLEKRLEVARRLAGALKAGRLQLYYQPQVHLATGQVCGAEALLRWFDPEWGWVSPTEFIPIAEERGMMVCLGEWVLEEACKQMKAWRNAGLVLEGRLAINVAAQQMEDAAFVDRVQGILGSAGIEPSLFEFELTESGMMADPERAVTVMQALKAMGLALSIDDFGTGYSSLSYLKRFAADKLKIDLSFVRDMLDDRNDHAIVSAIIAMAKRLGLKVLAEGVEEAAQAQALLALGCDEAQGYYFGRPEPAEVFARRWLRGARPKS